MGILRKLLGLPDVGMLKEKLENGALLLDVRTKGEYNAGHAKGSVNIPMEQVPRDLKKLTKNNPIVAVCESGARSGQVVRFLKSKGFQAYNGGRWKTFR